MVTPPDGEHSPERAAAPRALSEIVAGAGDEEDPIEAIGRLGARLILQQALEEELTEFLGRERYERRGAPVAHRNGYERLR